MYRVCVYHCGYVEHLLEPPNPSEETYTCPECSEPALLFTDDYFLNRRMDQIEQALGHKGEEDDTSGPYGPSGKVDDLDIGELYE
jgi:hypothetical protein